MKFYSFIRENWDFHGVEVQLSLLPGLPEVKFSGLADMAIRESATRLKSAFQAHGFKWPGRQQIVVHLSPASLKKTSGGFDLALALALLWKTGQMDFSRFGDKLYAYGEVGLDGSVKAPEDWDLLPENESPIITGPLDKANHRKNLYVGYDLKALQDARLQEVSDWRKGLKKPPLPDISFSPSSALLLKTVALGELSFLLCGEAGSGKTTLAENLYHLLQAPEKKAWREALRFLSEEGGSWRPFLAPHHTTTPQSMIGGGSALWPGEISKAHGGMLFMDEYLEFHPKVQEALREPLEKGRIRLVRGGKSALLPADFLLAAATNLCPCGDYIPGRPVTCPYSLKKCQSHLDRLSGPMLDRFDLVAFSYEWKGEAVIPLQEILEQVEDIRDFILKTRGGGGKSEDLESAHRESAHRESADLQDGGFPRPKGFSRSSGLRDGALRDGALRDGALRPAGLRPAGRMELNDLIPTKDPKVKEHVLPKAPSQRRKRALFRLARVFADLEKEKTIQASHFEKAYSFSVKNFFLLKNRLTGF